MRPPSTHHLDQPRRTDDHHHATQVVPRSWQAPGPIRLASDTVARLAHDPGDGYGDDDLAGPVGLPLEAYERCARESELALAPLVLALAPRVAATDGW